MANWSFRQSLGASFAATQTRVNTLGTGLAYRAGDIWRTTDGGVTWANVTSVFNGGDGTFVALSGLRWSVANYPGRDPSVSTDDGLNFNDTFAFGPQANSGAGDDAGVGIFGLANVGWGGWTTDAGATWTQATGTWPNANQPVAGSIIYDGTQFVFIDSDTLGNGDIYTAPNGFSQGSGPVWSHVGSFTNGMGKGQFLDSLISYDPSVGYVVGGQSAGVAAIFISPTVGGLLTASGVDLGGGGSTTVAVFAGINQTVLHALFDGTLNHSTDGGVTWSSDNLNFPNVGERAISITYDAVHGQIYAYGVQSSLSTFPLAPPPVGPQATVPNIVGIDPGTATGILTLNLLVLGTTNQVYSPTVPAGLIATQAPTAGASVPFGTAVNINVSKGPAPAIVPDVRGMTAADARTAIELAGLHVGTTLPIVTEATPIGSVDAQDPLGGTIVQPGSLVNLLIAVFLEPFDVEQTVISQYANSPTLLRLIDNMQEYIDPRTNFEAFYDFVWNIDTAVGFGLDIWGRIIGVSRLLELSSSDTPFGFFNADFPYDWENFGGGTFRTDGATTAYFLPDDGYRVLLLTKALANVVATTAPSLNRLLQNLFPGRGAAYVVDNGGMSMTFTFKFALTPVEFAILTQSGALPHPAGVAFNVVVSP